MLLILLLQFMRSPCASPLVEQPDIVVFFMDDVGARDIELLNSETPSRVPNINAIGQAGTWFISGYAQPKCAPSRVSIYLSEWQGTTGGFGCHPNTGPVGPGPMAETLPQGLTSLPKVLEGAGYNTALFGRWGMGTWPGDGDGHDYPWTPLLWGFETWRAGVTDGVDTCGGTGYEDWLRVDDGHLTENETLYQTTAIEEEFLEWWETTPSPRFAMVAFQGAHLPSHWPPSTQMPSGWTQPSLSIRNQYEAVIQSVDFTIGNMLDVIDLDETFVVLLGDNGTPAQCPPTGYTSGKVKNSCFQGGVRVPFMVAGYGFPTGQYSIQPVSVVDIIPTLADLTGIGGQWSFDGQSLLPALDGNQLTRDWVYVQNGDNGEWAVMDTTWKLRHPQTGTEELYYLVTDPFENTILDVDAPQYASIVEWLRDRAVEAQS